MIRIAGAGVLGPGLPDWQSSLAILRGLATWQPGEVRVPLPAMLAPTERRRTALATRLAVAVASAAASASGLPAGRLRGVFGSGNGDPDTVVPILDELARPVPFVSPTQFHNSVHNAAAGYWSIGAASRTPVTCIGCHDGTAAASLLAAVADCEVTAEPVLLCLYDVPMPAPIAALRPTREVFGAALVLTPGGAGPALSVRWDAAPARDDAPLGAGLAELARSNPAARSLRLLEAVARAGEHRFDMPLLDGRLIVQLSD